jgi:hypothetical protein
MAEAASKASDTTVEMDMMAKTSPDQQSCEKARARQLDFVVQVEKIKRPLRMA